MRALRELLPRIHERMVTATVRNGHGRVTVKVTRCLRDGHG